MDEPAHALLQTGGDDVAHAADIGRAHERLVAIVERDLGREVIDDLGAVEQPQQGLRIGDVAGKFVDGEPFERGAAALMDEDARTNAARNEAAHEVGPDVASGAGDSDEHRPSVKVLAAARQSYEGKLVTLTTARS